MKHLWLIILLAASSNLVAQDSTDKANRITIDASKIGSADSVNHFRSLAQGVGWDINPTLKTTTELKRIGVNRIRCLNVDPLPGTFNNKGEFVMKEPDRLLQRFQTCRDLGATPYIVIAIRLHPELIVNEQDIPEADRGVMGNPTKKNEFGPKDWTKFRNHYKRLFKYVLIEKNFPQARFEVGGEPDIGGGIYVPKPPMPALGSREAYDAYMDVYRNVLQAALEFERDNPGQRVVLGGPTTSAFKSKTSGFTFATQFVRDCADQHLRVDFVALHLYGNLSPIRGDQGTAAYPPLVNMIQPVRDAIDQHLPGTPLCLTEWGPTYHTNNTDVARVNANHIGAAWCAEFLNTMRLERIENSILLLTTDSANAIGGGKFENVWGWPSFFVNPSCYWGRVYPKPIFHLMHMVTRLTGQEIKIDSSQPIGIFASIDPQAKHLTLLAWNSNATIPEFEPAIDHSQQQVLDLVFQNLPADMVSGRLLIRRWQLSENEGNALTLFDKHETLTEKNTTLPLVDSKIVMPEGGSFTHRITMPPSAVTFLEITVP